MIINSLFSTPPPPHSWLACVPHRRACLYLFRSGASGIRTPTSFRLAPSLCTLKDASDLLLELVIDIIIACYSHFMPFPIISRHLLAVPKPFPPRKQGLFELPGGRDGARQAIEMRESPFQAGPALLREATEGAGHTAEGGPGEHFRARGPAE